MKKKIGFGCLTVVVLAIVAVSWLVIGNNREASRRDRLFESNRLNGEEKGALKEALRLQEEFGSLVWPGLNSSRPIVLFNDRYEFLVRAFKAPSGWARVSGDVFLGEPYFRRTAEDPQAFAVRIDDFWAASLGTRDVMNRDFFLGARSQLPPLLAPLMPFKWASLSKEHYAVCLLHEIFHAYQAEENPLRFSKANAVYAFETDYPFYEEKFVEAWDEEGSFLAEALEAKDDGELREWIERFLEARENRRRIFSLTPELVAFEQELEWLEGLAKYVEIKFFELAASSKETPESFRYNRGLPYWRMEFKRIKGRLGHKDGDYRFYLSGMAQARLLDRLMMNWKDLLFRDDLSLEELLRNSVVRTPSSFGM